MVAACSKLYHMKNRDNVISCFKEEWVKQDRKGQRKDEKDGGTKDIIPHWISKGFSFSLNKKYKDRRISLRRYTQHLYINCVPWETLPPCGKRRDKPIKNRLYTDTNQHEIPWNLWCRTQKQQFHSTFNDPSYVLIDDDTAVSDMAIRSTYGHRIHGGQWSQKHSCVCLSMCQI